MKRHLLTLGILATTFCVDAQPPEVPHARDLVVKAIFDGERPRPQTVAQPVVPYRRVNAIGRYGHEVTTDDGATWSVIAGSNWQVYRTWDVNDAIVIFPVNSSWMWGAKYKLYNTHKRNEVYANLTVGPIIAGPCTNENVYLDYANMQLTLQDGQGNQTLWYIDADDTSEYYKWLPNEAVIVGSNEKMELQTKSKCGYVLINVARNKYVRADLAAY